VEAVEIAGIKKLKIYNMVNTKMFYHPNYYKNLRKLARLRNRDQAISPQAATAANGRTPGTGLTTLKKLVTKLNKENEPSGGWRASDNVQKRSSSQASSGARINKR
jgi:hypothetical protein